MRRKNTLSIDPETNPEFILVNSQNGKTLHEFFNKPNVGYIENLKYKTWTILFADLAYLSSTFTETTIF